MNTIKYLKFFLLLLLLIINSVIGSKIISNHIEKYTNYHTINSDYGLPLSTLNTITFRDNTSYKEINENEVRKLLFPLVNTVSWGEVNELIDSLVLNDTEMTKIINKELLMSLEKQINIEEPKFQVIKSNIITKYKTTTNELLITSKHIIYRDGRMYGFILDIQTLWTYDSIELKGFTKVEPTGITLQDNIVIIQSDNNTSNNREYGDSKSFIQGEAIMKDNKYEDDLMKHQMYGLLIDRGINSKSYGFDKKE
jgi:hypothetical protein